MARYNDLRDRLTIDSGERNQRINQLLQDLSTAYSAGQNRASDRAKRSGASVGAQNAQAASSNYALGESASKGINTLNQQIDEQNRAADQYIESLIQQDRANRLQMIGNLGGGLGRLAGFGLSGLLSPSNNTAYNPTMAGMPYTPGQNTGGFDLSNFSLNLSGGANTMNPMQDYFAKNWYNKGGNNFSQLRPY